MDLVTGKASLLLREASRSGGPSTAVAEVPERGRYLLLTRALDRRGTVERAHTRSAEPAARQGPQRTRVPPNYTWKEYAQAADDGGPRFSTTPAPAVSCGSLPSHDASRRQSSPAAQA